MVNYYVSLLLSASIECIQFFLRESVLSKSQFDHCFKAEPEFSDITDGSL